MLNLRTLAIIQAYINRYGWSIYFAFGSIGCLLNICLFSRQYFRTISCCLYFLSSSAAMFVVLCIGIIPFIYGLNHPNPYNTNSSFCRGYNYIVQGCSMMYRWLMAIACIDRCFNTSNNISRQQMLTIRLTYRIIVVVIIIWLILPFYLAVWSDVVANTCIIPNTTVAIYSSFFIIVTSSLLPLSTMLVCTLIIRRNLAIKRQLRLHMQFITQQQQEQNRLTRSQDRQVLLMLFVQIFVYIISNIPWTGFLMYSAFTNNQIKSAYDMTIALFAKFLLFFLAYTYLVLSFYMYTLSSCTFRRELIKMLKSSLCCQNHPSFLTNHTRTRIQPSIA